MTTRTVALALMTVLTMASAAAAEMPEPLVLDGTWVGTWWMGKYEEPIEMHMVQTGAAVSGEVAMIGYPDGGRPAAVAEKVLIQAGWLEDDRVVLTWLMGGRQFTATLTRTAAGTLAGLGSEDGRVATGLGLSRAR